MCLILRGTIHDKSRECCTRIEDMIARYGLRPAAVLLTHGHFDHLSAADAIRKRYNIKVYAGENERSLMLDENSNLSVPLRGQV